MQIHVLTPLGDNFVYVLEADGRAAVIDPTAAQPVLDLLQRRGLALQQVLLTHHHADHTAGCPALRQATGCAVVGPDDVRLPDLDRAVTGGATVDVPGAVLHVLSVPGHTRSHVAYVHRDEPLVFTGDAVFVAGCGRLMEGTADDMWQSMCRMRELPPATQLYCGHDYTLEDLEFAAHVLPSCRDIACKLRRVRDLVAAGQLTVPSTIAEERRTNLFMRADEADVAAAVDADPASPPAVFAALRRLKDRW